MEAFFFGPPSWQLFGVYHPPDPVRDRYQGLVLCYPFGQEYMRAHRAFRQLAMSLSEKGFHVLRFDYRGTGDSGGDMQDLTSVAWLEDIDYAIQELKDMAGLHKVALLGLRLGGLLAGVAAARRRDLSDLVMWDPIITGREYVGQIEERIGQAPAPKRASNFVAADGSLHFNGFSMPSEFRSSLGTLSLLTVLPACRRILQLVSHEAESFAELASSWRRLDGFQHHHVPAEHDWNYVDHVGGVLMPQPVLQKITEWV